MKNALFTFLTSSLVSLALIPAIAQESPSDLSALVNYNFSGSGASFNSLGSEVYYGFREQFNLKKGKGQSGTVLGGSYYEISPSISTPISLAKKENYVPGLLLPGSFNVVANIVFKINKFLYISPANFGAKVLSGYGDQGKTIFQHNIRSGFAIQHKNLWALQFQYTWAWHNGTTNSQESFSYVFSRERSNIEYITATLQTKVSRDDAAIPTYLVVQLRNLSNAGSLPGLSNSRFITMGIRASILDLNVGSRLTDEEKKARTHKLVNFRN